MAKRGRPTAYRQDYAEQAEKLCKLGATDVEMADFFGVAVSSISKWKHDHPEFSEALKRGKVLADANVADRLYQRAMGYSHDAVKIAASPNGDHVAVPFTEHYPPDTTAAIFWLKNRQRDKWRDKHDLEHAGPDGGAIPLGMEVTFVSPEKDAG